MAHSRAGRPSSSPPERREPLIDDISVGCSRLSDSYGVCRSNMKFAAYNTDDCFDEMFDEHARPRAAARPLIHFMETLPDGELLRRQQSAERALLHMGITFNVYGDTAGTERIFPFDLVPRIVAASEWGHIERGLKQRIRALNLFLDDIYHEQKIVKDGVVPAGIINTASSFRKQCMGLNPPGGVWCHV